MNISEILNGKEGLRLEFKRELPLPDKLARELVALSNTKGGSVVIGYDEKNDEICGIDFNQQLEEKIMNIATTNCEPIIRPYIHLITHKGKTLLVIEVYQGMHTPYFVTNLGKENGVILRVGSTNRVADKEQIKELERQSANISFDETYLIHDYCNVFNNKLIANYLDIREKKRNIPKEEVNEKFLIKIGAIMKVNGDVYPTVGGILLFSDYPQQFAGLRNSIVRCARFKGKERGFFVDQNDYEGDIKLQIENTINFILRNIRIQGNVNGVVRDDKPEYPFPVIRELIVNAVCHRDYSLSGKTIFIEIYDDRMEIISPGYLPGNLSSDNILGNQFIRNKIVARRLFEMGYVENWGLGLTMVVNEMENRGGSSPLMIEKEDTFKVILKSLL